MRSRGPSARSVLVVDREPLSRAGWRSVLGSCEDLELVGEVLGTAEGREWLREQTPDAVVVEPDVSKDSGLDFVRHASRDHDLSVLVVSRLNESIYAERCLQAGASGFLPKGSADEAALLGGVRRVLDGHLAFSPEITERLLRRSQETSEVPQRDVQRLSDRELEVLERLGHGMTTQQVAEELHLGLKTVQTYCGLLKKKLELENFNQLICRATRHVLERRGA